MKYCYLLLAIFLFGGCDKDATIARTDCASLQRGLVNNDVALINKSLSNLINMPCTRKNLEEMAITVSENCDMGAILLCFDCIYTNPPQSEMRFRFLYKGDSTVKVLDLTHSPDDKIKPLAVHE